MTSDNKVYEADISDFVDDPANANRGTERGLKMLDNSIGEVGLGRGILVDAEGRIVAGNKTRQTACEAGFKKAIVVETDGDTLVINKRVDMDLSDGDPNNKARKAAYYDNKTAVESIDFDPEQLMMDIEQGVNLDGLFYEDEIEELLAEIQPPSQGEDTEPQIDRADVLRQEWGTELGQLWALGEHRLIVGDSRDEAVIKTLMKGDRAHLVFTDPPYGVAVGAKNRMLNSFQKAGRNLTDIKDDQLNPDRLKKQLLPAFVNVKSLVMSDDCTVFVTAPQVAALGMMMIMMKEAGLSIRHVLIWMKNAPTFSMGRLDYDYQHEPILLTWGKRHKRPMKGEHRTSVWQIPKPRSSADHPTMKPVPLVENALLNNSDRGDISFDAYCGSGTSIIAAENLKRRCRAVEIDAGFAAVSLQRFFNHTGIKPELIND